MTPEQILADVETRSDGERIRRMRALGRQAEAEPETAAALRALAGGGFYARRLALLACAGSRDGSLPLAMVSDPSRLLRGLALCLVPLLCTDAQVGDALDAVPLSAQKALLGRLVRRGRRGPVEAFLGRLAGAGSPALGPLLAFGSPAIVEAHWERVAPLYGLTDWRRLAGRHPDAVLRRLQAAADAQTGPDVRGRMQANAALPLLAERRPDGALTLVRARLRHDSISQVPLQALAETRPNEVADLALGSGDRAAVQFGKSVHKLTPERLLALLARRPETLGWTALWLKRLGPDTRRAVYAAAGQGWRDSEGKLDPALAALLPGTLRADEGRRCFGLPALLTRFAARLPYASLLPWDEAQAALKPFAGSPDPEQRAAALAALIGAARYERAHLPDALALTEARSNEQDPIRLRLLAALAALPPGRWAAADLDPLGRILRAALSAADLSSATARYAERLVTALVPFHPAWAAEWLGTLAKERGEVQFSNLAATLSDREVERIAPALAPVLASWETRERETLLLSAARSFGRRLRVFPALTEMMERRLAVTTNAYAASQILALLSAHCPERLAARVPALIAQDPSSIVLSEVHEFLHRRRQDLLTPFLGHTAYKGRFSTGQTRFVLPVRSGFERWTAAQQEMFARTLDEVTRDTGRDTPSVISVIGQLAALPAVEPARLIALARRGEQPATRDYALQALARLDGERGVPELIASLGDARARIAIYALRTALLEMPPAAALALLRAVPRDKVTVAKEVVRLLGEIKSPDAYPALLALGAEPLHRDIRVALLRALWDHLEDDRTWPVLDAAAADPDAAVAGGVVRVPADRVSPRAQARLLNLIAALLRHPDPKVRVDTLLRCAELPLSDPGQTLLSPLLASLGSRLPDESRWAAQAVFATYPAQAAAVAGALAALGPNRKALQTAVSALKAQLVQQTERQRALVRALLAALAPDSVTASVRAELIVLALPPGETADALAALAAGGVLHADALEAAAQAVGSLRSRAAAEWDTLEAALAASPDPGLRRLAVAALTAGAATSDGWTAARRRRLAAYGQDRAPLVAAAAQFTFPPDDAPEGNAP